MTLQSSSVCLCAQDYKSPGVAVMICATLCQVHTPPAFDPSVPLPAAMLAGSQVVPLFNVILKRIVNKLVYNEIFVL